MSVPRERLAFRPTCSERRSVFVYGTTHALGIYIGGWPILNPSRVVRYEAESSEWRAVFERSCVPASDVGSVPHDPGEDARVVPPVLE